MPSSIVAGTTTKVLLSFSDFPPPTWTADLYIAGEVTPAKITGAQSGNSFLFTIDATTSALLKPGNYSWRVTATSGAEVYSADAGTVNVERNIAAASAGDFQTWAAKTLPIVEAAIEGRLTADIESYSIAGRAVSKIPMKELLSYRASLQSIVQQEQTPGSFVRNVSVSFTPRY
jgi:hypothetical protein